MKPYFVLYAVIAAAYIEAAAHSWSNGEIRKSLRELVIAVVCACIAGFSIDPSFWSLYSDISNFL
jgi:hypothetical protein